MTWRRHRTNREDDARGRGPEPGFERSHAQHELKILGDEEKRAEHGEEAEDVDGERAGDLRILEDIEIDHRIGEALLAA